MHVVSVLSHSASAWCKWKRDSSNAILVFCQRSTIQSLWLSKLLPLSFVNYRHQRCSSAISHTIQCTANSELTNNLKGSLIKICNNLMPPSVFLLSYFLVDSFDFKHFKNSCSEHVRNVAVSLLLHGSERQQ